jgi:hypothetical protein
MPGFGQVAYSTPVVPAPLAANVCQGPHDEWMER